MSKSSEQTLESKDKASRDVALARAADERLRKREAFTGRQAAELADFNSTQAREAANAEARAEATRKALAAELAADVHAQLGPLWRAFREQPTRLVALQIAEAWQVLTARAMLELGAELNPHMLCMSLIDLIGGNRAIRAGADFDFSPTNYGESADRAIRKFPTGDAALIYDALLALEKKIAEVVAGKSDIDDELARRRYAALKAQPTLRDASLALEAVEAAWKNEQDEKRIRAFVPPPSLGDRVRGVYNGLPEYAGQR
jgi:hypothetical protein